MRLVAEGGERWSVRDGDQLVARYAWEEMRFSISWKAYCFRDERERHAWREHADDLDLGFILDALEADLRERERLRGPRPPNRELAELLVDEYVQFPAPSAP